MDRKSKNKILRKEASKEKLDQIKSQIQFLNQKSQYLLQAIFIFVMKKINI